MGLGGLEPPTSSLSVKRSNHLSYRPKTASLSLMHPKSMLKPKKSPGCIYLVVCETYCDAACDLADHVEDHRVEASQGRSENHIHNRQRCGERHNSRQR